MTRELAVATRRFTQVNDHNERAGRWWFPAACRPDRLFGSWTERRERGFTH